MHYRNGREAKNGDRVVQLTICGGGKIEAVGILCDATAGNDYCNGIVATRSGWSSACLIDCLHEEDLVAILAEKGLDKRPAGK